MGKQGKAQKAASLLSAPQASGRGGKKASADDAAGRGRGGGGGEKRKAAPLVEVVNPDDETKFYMCEPDHKAYCACMSWLPMSTLVERNSDPDFQKQWAEAKRNLASGPSGARDYVAESVSKSQGAVLEIERCLTIVNAREYKEIFGQMPKVKTTRYLPTMCVPTEAGASSEHVWAFNYHPGTPYRTLRIKTFLKAENTTGIMTPATHLYREQGADMLQWASSSNRGDWEAEKLIAGGDLKCIGDHSQQLGIETPYDTMGGPAPASAARRHKVAPRDLANGDGSGAEEGDEDESEEEASEGDDDDDEKATDFDDAETAVTTSTVPLLVDSSKKAKSAATPSPANKPPRKPGSRGPRSLAGLAMLRAASSAEVGGDSVSAAGGADNGNSSEADKYIKSLDLVKTMLGARLGVQAHHAGNLVNKLMPMEDRRSEARRLKNHIRLHTLAENLSGPKLATLTKAELSHALEEVGAIVEIPTVVQLAVLQHYIHEDAMPTKGLEQAGELLRCVWPWAGADSEPATKVNLQRPVLHTMGLSFDDRVSHFTKFWFERVISGLVAEATLDTECYFYKVVDMMGRRVADIMERTDDVEANESSVLCGLNGIAVGVRALYEPRLLTNDLADSNFSDLKGLAMVSDDAKPCLQCIALALHDSEILGARLKAILRNEAALVEVRPIMQEMQSCLHGKGAGHDMVDNARLLDFVRQWPRISASVDEVLTKPVQDDLVRALEKAYTKCKSEVASGAGPIDYLEEVTNLIKEAFGILHAVPNLGVWKADLTALVAKVEQDRTDKSAEDLLRSVVSSSQVEAKLPDLENLAETTNLFERSNAIAEMVSKTVGAVLDFGFIAFPMPITDKATRVVNALYLNMPNMHNSGCYTNTMMALIEGRSLSTAYEQLAAKCKTGEQAYYTKASPSDVDVATLSVLYKKACESSERVDGNGVQKAFKSVLGKLLGNAKVLLEGIGGASREKKKNDNMDLVQKVTDIKGGVVGGGSWTDNADQKKMGEWSYFFNYAKGSVLKDKTVAGMRKDWDKAEKVLAEHMDLIERYCLPKDDFATTTQGVLKEAWATFVCGLLLERFKQCTDKADLKCKVAKDLQLLVDKGIDRKMLPGALKVRAEMALRFQVAV